MEKKLHCYMCDCETDKDNSSITYGKLCCNECKDAMKNNNAIYSREAVAEGWY